MCKKKKAIRKRKKLDEIEKILRQCYPDDTGWLRKRLRRLVNDAFSDGRHEDDFDTQEEAAEYLKDKYGFPLTY